MTSAGHLYPSWLGADSVSVTQGSFESDPGFSHHPSVDQPSPHWEHSAILTSHRGPLYNGGKLLPTSFERTHPWDVLRLSPSPKFVQANNGTRFASSSTHALTNGSIPSNSSSMNPHPPCRRSATPCGGYVSPSPGASPRRLSSRPTRVNASDFTSIIHASTSYV